MEYTVFPVGPIAANCTIIWDDVSCEAVVCDPGGDGQRIVSELQQRQLRPTGLLCTHAHFDHIDALSDVRAAFPDARIMLHKSDSELYNNTAVQGRAFGMQANTPPPVDRWIDQDDIIMVGEHKIKVLYTPGHAPGHTCFAFDHNGLDHIVCGDTVFAGSIGRTDLWGGDFKTLINSIITQLFVYTDNTVLIPGHGPETTVGHERTHNPFLMGQSL